MEIIETDWAKWDVISGDKTYKVQGVVWYCSCPSRKYPCKHMNACFERSLEQGMNISDPESYSPDF